MSDNPFDTFDLDPLASPDALTEALRERVEDAAAEERQALRAAWEELTLHPRKRIALALRTFIEPEPEFVLPPSAVKPLGPTPTTTGPTLHAGSPVPITELHATMARAGLTVHEPTGYVSIASDPLLKET